LLTEKERVYDTALYNYENVTNPSCTHKAYKDSSSELPIASSDFETTEFSTSDYEYIDEDDSNYVEAINPNTDDYLYHKFLMQSTIDSIDVRRFKVRVMASCDDSSPKNLDGVVLYAWNGTSWVELARNSNSNKLELSYSTTEPEVARQFVDSGDGYIRLILRSRNRHDGINTLSLRTYYAECELNEGLDLTVNFSHKAVLDEDDDVIMVKNLTTDTELSLGVDYTISTNRRAITINNQNSGDEIQVKYNRYFEVMFATIPEVWLNGDEGCRSVEIELQTISESK